VRELNELVARDVAAWNDPDPDKRRTLAVDLRDGTAIRYTMPANRMDAMRSPTP
jgi:hypothetical protein